GVAPGPYPVVMETAPLAGETDLGDNAFAAGTVTIAPRPVFAEASATPLATDVDLRISFTCRGTDGTPPYEFAWDVGEVGTAPQRAPRHSSAVVHARDDAGATCSTSLSVTIAELLVTGTSNVTSTVPGAAITFISVASGGSGAPYTYVWDFGDGSPKAAGPIVTHAYAAGRFTPSVTVLDGSGASHTTLLPIITVENQPVTVLSSPPYFAIGLTTAIIVGIGAAV